MSKHAHAPRPRHIADDLWLATYGPDEQDQADADLIADLNDEQRQIEDERANEQEC